MPSGCGAVGFPNAACAVLLVGFTPELWPPAGAMLLWQTACFELFSCCCESRRWRPLLCGAHIVAWIVFAILLRKLSAEVVAVLPCPALVSGSEAALG